MIPVRLARLDMPGAIVLAIALVCATSAYLGYVYVTGDDGVLLSAFFAALGGLTGTYGGVKAAIHDAGQP